MKVSILIPSYNSSRFIEEAVNSAITQTYKNIEIIIVDDGSTDSTVDQCRSITEGKKNIRLYAQSNMGACAARNFAFQQSEGDYILFLDADDIISPNKVKAQMEVFERYGDDIVLSGQWDRFENNIEEAQFPVRFLDRDWENPVDWLVNAWEGKGMAQTSVWLTPRHLIEKAGPWEERLKVNQDGEFFSRVLLQAKAIKFCSEAKLYYRSGKADGVSLILSEDKASSLLLSYQLYKEHILKKENSDRVKHALMKNFLYFIYRFYGQYPQLVSQAREEIKLLGFDKLPVHGGSYFRMLAGIIGFENTLKLRGLVKGI
jgi:glycosyltransferase involved in cell wall biosynthesis